VYKRQAYIPTNVISITDGQIYLEGELFYAGIRPAINVGISVSRVGGAAQIKGMKQVAGRLRLDMAQYREMAAFAQFGSDLDKATRALIERGQRTTEILKQPQYAPMPVEQQIMSIYVAVNGYLDDIPVSDVLRFEEEFHKFMKANYAEVAKGIKENRAITPEIEATLKKAIKEFKDMFTTSANIGAAAAR